VGKVGSRVHKLPIQRHAIAYADSKRDEHAAQGDHCAQSCILLDHRSVNFKTHEKEKEDKPDVGGEIEERDCGRIENVFGEAWDASKGRRPEENTAENFGDDAWLTDFAQKERKELGCDED
jgi:hypothetical protein